jgi:hypothetical protein
MCGQVVRVSASLYRAGVTGGDRPMVAPPSPLMSAVFGPNGKWRGGEMERRGNGESVRW